MSANQTAKLKVLQQAFVKADKDGDSLLNKVEFKEFVEIGYQKQCPNGMYVNLCKHFKRDPDIGIDWTTARTVWLQAQSGSTRAKTPQPPKQQNGTTQLQSQSQSLHTSNNIKQAFIQCDKDGDGLLNKQEFHQFVKVGFKKPSVPNGMYEQVCGHFKKDASIGIDWLSAFALWKQSNPNAGTTKANKANKKSGTNTRATTPPPKKKPPNLKRLQTIQTLSPSKSPKSRLPPVGQLSPTKSTGQLYAKHQNHESFSGSGSALTERNLRALEKNSGYSNKSLHDDEHSVESDRSYRSQNRRLRRVGSTSRANASFDDGVDATQMVVQMMETKVKNLQNQLKLERNKRKKTEELAQSLLTSNEEYKKQTSDLNNSHSKLKSESKQMKDQLRKLKQIVDDDRNTIKHLKEQRKAMKTERDEGYGLLSKIEKEHAVMVKKEKVKHKEQMEKLSAGFLQSLGAEPGKDVASVIKELKEENVDLNRRVDELAATLARKSESLLHALSAVDSLAMIDENNQLNVLINEVQSPSHHTTTSKDKMRNKFKELNQRRKSMSFKKMKSKTDEEDDGSGISGLPAPPRRRNSQVGLKPHHRPTATFFKRAVGDKFAGKRKLDITNAKNGKELQFVSQQLTSDVKNKTQSIENLEIANTALMEQMQKMQKQMQAMKKTNDGGNVKGGSGNRESNSNVSVSGLP